VDNLWITPNSANRRLAERRSVKEAVGALSGYIVNANANANENDSHLIILKEVE
jgi:hypothetical protein